MYKIIGNDGKEYGPVSAEQLQQWVREGRVNAQTKVLPEGAPAWTTFGELPEFAPATPTAPPPAGPAVGDAQPSVEEILARDYRIGIGDCITRGWELVKSNLGLLVGGTILVFLAQGAIQTPGSFGRILLRTGHRHAGLLAVGGLLAAVGTLAAMILAGPLMGGLYWPYLRLLRGQPAEIGDFFAGFRRGFVNLMLCQIVITLLIAAIVMPPAIVFGAGMFLHYAKHSAAGIGLAVVGGALLLAAFVVMVYLSVCWFFALPLAVDRQLRFWEAMKLSKRKVSQHWWQVFGLSFVAGLIGAAGILLCCVGMLFTMPISLASLMCGYEVIFGRGTAQTS